jgi:hypothetical protein
MKNPLNPLNQDKIIIEKFGSKILSVKPLNPLNRNPLNRVSLCTQGKALTGGIDVLFTKN